MGLNDQASKLLIDAQFFNAKAHECHDMLVRLDDYVQDNVVVIDVVVNGQPISMLPISLTDISTLNDIFVTLFSYYRKKHVKAMEHYRSVVNTEMPT